MHPEKTFAFFDVDDTLVTCKTMFSFQDFWFLSRYPSDGHLLAKEFNAYVAVFRNSGRPREELNSFYYSTFAGRRPEEVKETARLWFEEHRNRSSDFYIKRTLKALELHREQGVEPVLISGSMVDILSPISEELAVKHVLATRLTIADGYYTGEIIPPQTIGTGKAVAIVDFLSQQGVEPDQCWAYGDHSSDLPMLESVGNPVLVSDEEPMINLARKRGWQLLTTGTDVVSHA